jgi:multisubunit Na+/H+ antiporter MnhE subunit
MEQLTRWNLTRVILTAVYLWFGWLLFSWSVEPASLIIGAVFSAGIALLTYPVFIEHDEAERRSHVPRVRYLLLYLLLLIFQMYVASFKVCGRWFAAGSTPGSFISAPACAATSPGWLSPTQSPSPPAR